MVASTLYTLASTIIGILYPAFMSFKAMKSGTDTRKWLEYWAVYSLWSVVEWVALDNLVSGLPAYYIIKLVFLGWLTKEGASIVYHNVLEAQLLAHEDAIDNALAQASEQAVARAAELKAHVMELAKKHAGTLYQMMSKQQQAPPNVDTKPSGKAE